MRDIINVEIEIDWRKLWQPDAETRDNLKKFLTDIRRYDLRILDDKLVMDERKD